MIITCLQCGDRLGLEAGGSAAFRGQVRCQGNQENAEARESGCYSDQPKLLGRNHLPLEEPMRKPSV